MRRNWTEVDRVAMNGFRGDGCRGRREKRQTRRLSLIGRVWSFGREREKQMKSLEKRGGGCFLFKMKD